MTGKEQSHIVRSVRLRLQIPAVDKAFALQQRAKQCLDGDWYEELAKLLDKYAGLHECLYVPALNVDLETLPEDQFEKHFRKALLEAVDKALQQLLADRATAGLAAPGVVVSESGDLVVKGGGGPADVLRVSGEERYIDAWMYFLDKGILPWWMRHESPAVLETALLDAIRSRPVMFRECWYRAWHHGAVNVPRWLLQCSPALRQVMLEVLCPAALITAFRDWLPAVEKVFAAYPVKAIQYAGWHSFFDFLDSSNQYKSDALQRMTTLMTAQFPEAWAQYVKERLPATAATLLQQAAGVLMTGETITPVTAPPHINPPPAPLRQYFPDTPGQGIQVRNAGLVLLHPFLGHLFRHLGWLKEKDRVLEEQYAVRAVHLLEFLCSGGEQLPEYDMLFPKILCGLPPETTIERDIVLEPFEKQQAESLLKAVLEHWQPLSSSGMAALRETFLQREGLLQFSNDEWLLKVEHRTVDILISKLPWGIGVIRLPWMSYLLKVDWAL